MELHSETQTELAAVLEISRPAIAARLTGVTRWTVDELDQLASHYRVSPSKLLRPSGVLASIGTAAGRAHSPASLLDAADEQDGAQDDVERVSGRAV